MTTDALTVARAWVAALASLALVATWSLLARDPFPAASKPVSDATTTGVVAPSADPRIVALRRRQVALQRRARLVRQRHALQWAVYRRELGARQAQAAAAAAYTPVASSGWSVPSAPAPSAPVVETRSS
jgi:hypothetical protein